MKHDMKSYTVESHTSFNAVGEISGYLVRPGMFETNGATPLPVGVNFTVHTSGGTSCELLLFHRGEEEPYAVLPFPDEYRIGDVYSMIVFGLDIEDLEYAYRVDGPWDPKKGLRFRKENVLLEAEGTFTWLSTEGEDLGKIEKKLELAEQMEAPLARGERAGMIAYYMDGEKLGELPVVTAEAVEKAGYIDQLQKLFGKWAGFRNKAA